jgi:hypothetical protein
MQRWLIFSVKNFNQGDLLFHFEGSYHSNYQQGIIWWINKIAWSENKIYYRNAVRME